MGVALSFGFDDGLTADDYAALEKRGIRVVCDLRSTAERQAEPVAWPHACRGYWPMIMRWIMDTCPGEIRANSYRRSGAGDGLSYPPADAFNGQYRRMFGELLAITRRWPSIVRRARIAPALVRR
jgi:protein-tyrosine phosphatase